MQVIALLVSIGVVVVSGHPAPQQKQHRFGLPAHFSFRTVHNPVGTTQHNSNGGGAPPSVPQQTFFFRPSRVTLPRAFIPLDLAPLEHSVMTAKTVLTAPVLPDAEPVDTVTEVIPAEAVEAEASVVAVEPASRNHIPVMIPVPQDFVGERIVVSPEDLISIGLSGTMVDTSATITGDTGADTVVNEEPEMVVESEVAPNPEVVEEPLASSSGPLSEIDNTFVLTTADETITEEPIAEPIISRVQQPITSQVQQSTPNAVPSSRFHYSAYNDFLNTWLQLASVNLNRPDLLRLINPQPAAPIPVVSNRLVNLQEEQAVAAPESVPSAKSLFVAVEEVEVPQMVQEDAVAAALPPPAVEEDMMTGEFTSEPPAEVTTQDAMLFPAETTTEFLTIIEKALDDMTVPEESALPELGTPESVLIAESVAPETIIQENFISDLSPIQDDVTISESIPNTVEEIVSNSLVEEVAIGGPPSTSPFLLNAIPRVTSRGRQSGYRYSFSHVPQRGTYFFNSIAS